MFLNLERISCHTWRFFSAIFSKLFAKSEDLFEVNCFFPKWFCISFKSLWESNKKTFYFSVEKSMQVVQTAISISRAVFRGFFWQKKLKVCCAKQFRSSAESFIRIDKNAFNTSKGTLCGDISLRKLLFCIVISEFDVWKFVFLLQNRSKLFKRVPKNKPREAFCRKRKQRKLAIQRRFTGLSAETFVGCCQNCYPNVQRSIYSYYCFCKKLLFLEMFP